jgi:hypothetical protein
MKKGESGRIWWWVFLLVVAVTAALLAYLLGLERGLENSEKRPLEEVAVKSKKSVEEVREEPPGEEEIHLAEETIERIETRPPAREMACGQLGKEIQEFFTYLDNKDYIRNREGVGVSSYDRFKILLEKLSSNLPIPAGEAMDSGMIIENVFHFFRLLNSGELRFVTEVLKNEADSLELNLNLFYRWLMLGDRCPDDEGIRPPLVVSYRYAGFFLNTIGGRACLFRRALALRLLVSYYSLLIIHEADKRGENVYGIDIFPSIAPLAREMSVYPDFHFRDEYILQLSSLQNYYLQKR